MFSSSEAMAELKAAAESGRGCSDDYMILLMQSAGCAIDCRGYPVVPDDADHAAAAREAVRPYIQQLRSQNDAIKAEIKAKSDSGADVITGMAGRVVDAYAVRHPDGGLIIETVGYSRQHAVELFLGECDKLRYMRTDECGDLINWRKYANLGFYVVSLDKWEKE